MQVRTYLKVDTTSFCNPNKYHDERIVVVGGGNSAVEAASLFCQRTTRYF